MSDEQGLELGTEPMIRALVSHMFRLRFKFDKAKADEEAHEFIETMKIAKLEICHFPDGRSEKEDEGAIKIGLTVEDNVLKVVFGKKIAWMGFDKAAAAGFIDKFRFYAGKLK